MDFFKVESCWIFKAFIMASMVVISSAICNDPGTPAHGYRSIISSFGGFSDGTVVYFVCNHNYKLIGVKKIICIKERWNGKKPVCQSLACPLPPPIAHAHVTYNPGNTKGSYVKYACDVGYTSDGNPTQLLCDKDPKSQDFIWSGNFTCQKIRCGPPPGPRGGHGNVTTIPHGSTPHAKYYCYPGYVLMDYRRVLQETFEMSCSDSGTWRSRVPTCVKTCKMSDVEIDHGNIVKVSPRYGNDNQHNYTENVEVTFTCGDRYKLQGNEKLRCLKSGLWSGHSPRCVLNSCGSPGSLAHGGITFNNTRAHQTLSPLWTVAYFNCNTGYRLVGPSSRQCQPSGQWTERHNPTCEKSLLTCNGIHSLNHGHYTPRKQKYLLNDHITAECDPGFFLWGQSSMVCIEVQQDEEAAWHNTGCTSGEVDSSWSCSSVPECLLPVQYEAKCESLNGRAKYGKKHGANYMYCEIPPVLDVIPTKPPNKELDKMTIVVASTGSTLGALVVLLAALYCFRQRIRRLRRPSYRSRRYSDDDRIAFIAYAGDIHFILPSYDEAMSQVERSPPPFESVVGGAQESTNPPAANNNSSQTANQTGNTGSNLTAGNTNYAAEVGNTTSTRELTEERPIHIVSNPLADSGSDTMSNATEQNADHVVSGESERQVSFSGERLNTGDDESSPNRPAEDLPSSSSEDDLTSSQTQPLLGNSRRGVMV